MKMSRVCPAQMKKLLDLLSEDGVLKNGKVMYTNTNKQNFWKHIAVQLNAVEGGVYKNTWKWCKTWADWKNKTKRKANILLRNRNYSDKQPSTPLTDLELRLLKMINYPIDNGSETLQLEMLDDKVEVPDNTVGELERLAFYDQDYKDQDKNKIFIDEDEYNEKNCCNMNDVLCEVNDNGESSSMTDRREKVKLNGKLHKRKKLSLEEYQTRTKLELEKEKLQHKTEELRLRAIELKLKGDELKLKEIEMNKINYLTNIEEEKLKCFKDISASLKELVERSRSGNLCFPNSFE